MGHRGARGGADGSRRRPAHAGWRDADLRKAGLGQPAVCLQGRQLTRILPSPTGIAEAAGLLGQGQLVAFGTETVYGLGADATQGRAVAAIFTAKGRPHFNPLICHYASAENAFAQVQPSRCAERLAKSFWPGPLTLILPRRQGCPVDLLAGAGLDTLAVRVPGHAHARALIRTLGRPLAAPSANRSGAVSPTSAQHVMADLAGRIAAILDSGPCGIGLESTVIDVSGGRPTLLRPGGVPVEAIEALVGPVGRGMPLSQAHASSTLRSPGLLVSHYAPKLPVRLNATASGENEALLAFGPSPSAALVWNLSAASDLDEAATRLFAGLRWLDEQAPLQHLTGIAVMPVPEHGLGAAINDRLLRAAAPRS